MIKNVIFDMGNVLIRFDRRLFIERLGITGEDEELLMREVFASIEWAQQDRGSLDEADAEKQICARVPEHLHDAVHKLVSMWDRPILPIDGMEELIQELHENGYHIYLLSNASHRQHEYWERVPVKKYFEDTLISADTGLVKPQPEIFYMAAEKFGIKASESVFVDDMIGNCEGAVYTGMHAIVFHDDAAELRRKMIAMGIRCQAPLSIS